MRHVYTPALALYLCLAGPLAAQDIHYSQAFNSPLNLSPALAGGYVGEHRVTGNARRQWRVATPDYKTGSVSYDRKFRYTPAPIGGALDADWWGLGLQFNYDRAGIADLSLAMLGLNLSYSRRLAPNHILTAGGQLAGGQRSYGDGLTFNDEFDPNNPLTPVATKQTFPNTRKLYPSLSAGLNYRYQVPNSRTFLNLGGGAYHLNTPDVAFFDESDVKLQRRLSAYVLGTVMLGDRFDVIANYAHQWQGPYDLPLAGLRGKLYLLDPAFRTLALQFGVHWRLDDALIPVIAANVDNWEIGVSFDVTTSPYEVASQDRGGPELSVIYTFQKIRPDICVLCPEYL